MEEKCPKCLDIVERVELEVEFYIDNGARKARYPTDGGRTFHHADGSRCYLPGHFFADTNGEEADDVELAPAESLTPEEEQRVSAAIKLSHEQEAEA